jgi:hypothetical protein
MSIIALVDNRKVDKGIKCRDDIIVALLPEHEYSETEQKQFLRIEIDDPILEAKLLDQLAAGERRPVLIHPYAEYALKDRGDGQLERVMVSRSVKRFQRASMATATKEDLGTTEKAIDDRTTWKPILKKKKPGEKATAFTVADLQESQEGQK